MAPAKMKRPPVWRVTMTVPERAVPAFELAIGPQLDAVSWEPVDPAFEPGAGGPMRVMGFASRPLARAPLVAAVAAASLLAKTEPPEIAIERMPDIDWLDQLKWSFPPIDAARFHLRGSHVRAPRPAGRVTLVIDAGGAFGTGEHHSTRGCLLALDALLKRRRFGNVLDMGCGSGVLAMAAVKVCKPRALATDIDPAATRIAAANARLNGVARWIRCQAGDGYKSRLVRSRAPYDLVMANILARPLTRMATPLARNLAPRGVAVLAGLLRRQERMVLAAHRAQGLALLARRRLGDWTTLVVGRP
jgi:ribosomal protein L11 methyltransferase